MRLMACFLKKERASCLLGSWGHIIHEEAAALPVIWMEFPCILDRVDQHRVPPSDSTSIRLVPVFLDSFEPGTSE